MATIPGTQLDDLIHRTPAPAKSEASPTLEEQVAADRQRRLNEFSACLEEAIKTHRVQIVPVPVILPDGRISAELRLAAQ